MLYPTGRVTSAPIPAAVQIWAARRIDHHEIGRLVDIECQQLAQHRDAVARRAPAATIGGIDQHDRPSDGPAAFDRSRPTAPPA